jgi:hypothetical protein
MIRLPNSLGNGLSSTTLCILCIHFVYYRDPLMFAFFRVEGVVGVEG